MVDATSILKNADGVRIENLIQRATARGKRDPDQYASRKIAVAMRKVQG